jgi:hypothetical protein
MSRSPIDETRHWLEQMVVGLNLCPFAKRELVQDRIRIVEAKGEAPLHALAREFQILDNDDEVGTTLLVFPDSLGDFEEYLDTLAAAEEWLQAEGYEGRYQLASFHPDYRFDGSAPDDPANYTNRSPYPMLHLLREEELTQALAGYPDPEGIPARNKAVCRELGIPALSALLKAKP